MAVTYAQFIIEFPEFSDSSLTAIVTPELSLWDSKLDAWPDEEEHDAAVYRRTCVSLGNRQIGGMAITTDDRERYQREWQNMLNMIPRRGQISGGGLP